MAKKAKRGRPPGSKNKKKTPKGVKAKNVAKMEVSELRAYINDLEAVLAQKVQEERSFFESKISELTNWVTKTSRRAVKLGRPVHGRVKATPKYRSRKDPKLTYSGRGMMAGWLKAEMKESGKPIEHFLIK